MKGDREQRRVVVRRLLGIRDDFGEVPNEAVDAAAHMLGLSRRQVRRLVANGGDGDAREPFDLTDKMIDFLFAARGNAWRAHELLIDAGVALSVGPRQFQRAVEQRVDQALVAGARRGLDGVMTSSCSASALTSDRSASSCGLGRRSLRLCRGVMSATGRP